MFKLIRRWWKYLTAKLTGSFNEKADPKVQLEQAITEAREQDRRLRRAGRERHRQSEEGRDPAQLQDGGVGETQRPGPPGAADGRRRRPRRATPRTRPRIHLGGRDASPAGSFRSKRTSTSQKSMLMQATQASDQAKNAVRQNSMLLERKIAEKGEAALATRPGEDARRDEQGDGSDEPDPWRGRADVRGDQGQDRGRYAKASATAELNATSVDSSILEIEQATADVEAQSRLSQLRGELGLDTPAAAAAPSPANRTAARAGPGVTACVA